MLRQRAGAGFWGRLLDCFYCISVWVAAPIATIVSADWVESLLIWPALAAGAILLERGVPDHWAERAEDGKTRLLPETPGNAKPCCGGKWANAQATAMGTTAAEAPSMFFGYLGATALNVTCTSSGRRYQFAGPGSRVQINPHDAASLAALPELRMVRP